jgi:hypothetical protein
MDKLPHQINSSNPTSKITPPVSSVFYDQPAGRGVFVQALFSYGNYL